MIVPNAAPKLTILKASAGSGKTFSLALEYIAQAIKEGSDFRQVLAVTFTNKATKEMKERIVFFLKKLSLDEDKSLCQLLEEKTGLTHREIQKRSFFVLKNILHNYSHFSVSTIDSFNQKILRAFTREIGLIGNFNLELNTQKIVEAGIDLVLDSGSDKKDIKKWLLEFIKDKLQQGKSWDIKKDLKSLAMELYSEAFKIIELKHRYELPDAGQLQDYVQTLRKIKHAFEQQMKTFGRQAEAIATQYDLAVTDFKYGKTGAFNYFLKIQANPADCIPGSRVMACYHNPDNWFNKNSIKREEIERAVRAGLQDILVNALSFYEKKYGEYTTADAILRNIFTLGLFSEIKNAIDAYKRENDIFLLSDTNVFLKGIIGENEAPFIYEKTGSWYRNFLIDEFQDTSRLQWANFKPLVANSLAENQPNLIVGDAKQSIYRWRGGEWELIEKELLADFHKEYLETKNLETNWRSSPEVVAFNNAVFEILPHAFRSAFESLNTSEQTMFGGDFNLIYQNANQNVAEGNAGKTGYVKVDFSAKEENKKEWKEMALEWLKQNIDRLLEHGYSPGSIAILTRTKGEGAEVVDFLHEQNDGSGRRYEVLSNESLLLVNFPAIRLIINCLKFIRDPESELALANVAVEYFYTKNSKDKLSELLAKVTFKEELSSLFPSQFMANIEAFRQHSLLEAVAEIIAIFHLNSHPENTACLTAFQDVALNYVNENTNDTRAFLEWWDDEAGKQTLKSPENAEAIQVMTIHKSKGLEFDVVFIPFLNWNVDHNTNNDVYMWCENKTEPFSQLRVAPMRYQNRLSGSLFAGEFFDEKHRAYIDNLNLCYVAFTRAKQALFLHAELPAQDRKKGKKAFCVSDLLFDALATDNFALKSCFNEDEGKFESGNLGRRKNMAEKKAGTAHLFMQNRWTEKAELKRRGREFLKKDPHNRKQKINYGLIVHEILAELKGLDELEKVLARYQTEGLISAEEFKILKDQLDSIVANPEVARWFETGWEVKTESAILSKDNGELRPDRVMINNKSAIIIDFKTGSENPQHVKQIVRYRNKLIEMGYESVKAFLLYIANNKVKQIA